MSGIELAVKQTQQAMIYSVLAKVIAATSNHFLESGELVKLYCGSHLKYHLYQADSYLELLTHRDQLAAVVSLKELQLHQRKERLFKS